MNLTGRVPGMNPVEHHRLPWSWTDKVFHPIRNAMEDAQDRKRHRRDVDRYNQAMGRFEDWRKTRKKGDYPFSEAPVPVQVVAGAAAKGAAVGGKVAAKGAAKTGAAAGRRPRAAAKAGGKAASGAARQASRAGATGRPPGRGDRRPRREAAPRQRRRADGRRAVPASLGPRGTGYKGQWGNARRTGPQGRTPQGEQAPDAAQQATETAVRTAGAVGRAGAKTGSSTAW